MAEDAAAKMADMSVEENGPVIYTSEKEGSDETGDGSALKPFKTVLQALRHSDDAEPAPVIMVDGKSNEQKYEKVAKAQMKKVSKIFAQEKRKSEERDKKEAEKAQQREKNLEEAKKVTIEEDKSLPEAKAKKERFKSFKA